MQRGKMQGANVIEARHSNKYKSGKLSINLDSAVGAARVLADALVF